MTNRIIFGTISRRTAVAALLGTLCALVSGCSASQFVISADNTPVAGAAIKGAAHGGQQPIIGATVQLWAVGAGNYGSAATALGPSVQTVGPGGTFSLGAYTCPTSTTQVYITAQGGNPGLGASNPNIMLAAALGNCGSLTSSTFIFMNEVTTAATAYALGQYFTTTFGSSSSDSFGAPSNTQAQAGITNAFATANNLVTVSTGNAITSGTVSGAAGALTITPESSKLNTIADILSSCVNSAGGTAGDTSNCGKLFSAVVTTSGTAPTDTLQAAVYMSLNPTSTNTNGSVANLATLFALVPASSAPFPASSTQPTDWTVGIQYTDTTANAPTLPYPQWVSVDASGNLWVVSGNNSGTGDQLVELSPTGGPLQILLTSSTAGVGVGSYNPRETAIDTAGNVWLTTTSGSGYVFEVSGGPTSSTIGTSKVAGKAAWGIAIDGSNNVFVGEESSSTTVSLGEFPGSSSGANINEFVEYGNDEANVQPEYLAFDTLGDLWATSGSTHAQSYVVELSNITPCTTETTSTPCTAATTTSPAANTFTNISPVSISEAYGVATAPSGGLWVANGNVSTVTLLSSATSGANFGSVASINLPRLIAVDGAGNAWVSNGTLATATGTPGAVTEFSSTGAVLSTVNSGTAPNTAVGFAHAGINGGFGIATDPSGNVWVANFISTTSDPDPNSIFEIVGAAAPTVTPIALSLKNGTVGVRP